MLTISVKYRTFAETPNVAWMVNVIWKDLLWRAELYRLSNIGEDVQYRCFNQVYDVKSVSQPDTMPILENNSCLQIVETGFAEQF